MRNFGFGHCPILHRRKIILRFPFFGIALAHHVDVTRFKRLKQDGRITKIFQFDFVKIICPTTKGQISAPVILVSFKRDTAPWIYRINHIRGRGNGHDVQTRNREIHPLPLGLFQDRTHTCQKRKFWIILIKGESNRTGACLFDCVNFPPQPSIAPMSNGPKRFIRPQNILNSHRRSIGKPRFRSQAEFNPFAVCPRFDCFGQQPIERKRFIPGPSHQCLIRPKPKLPGCTPFDDVGI